MGRLVTTAAEGSMHLAVYCGLLAFVFVLSARTTAAGDVDFYPGFPDQAVLKRIRHVLNEWRLQQLHLQQLQDQESAPVPQFTYRFPEERNQNLQSDYFAVPPSDPRYYQEPPVQAPPLPPKYLPRPEENTIVYEDKRDPTEEETETKAVNIQVGPPLTVREDEDDSYADDVSVTPAASEADDQDGSYILKRILNSNNKEDFILVGIVAGCGAAAAAAVVALSIGWYKLHHNSKAAADIEYPAYGVTGPNKEITPTGDRRLAHSAQMYHYQHQKQQIIAMESNRVNNERRGSVSEGDSEEENEEGDYTVYECPGLAATGELEVKNPLFLDDPTPAVVNHNGTNVDSEKADDELAKSNK